MIVATAPDTKTYLMEIKGGDMRRITVPATWKVTFGPLVPSELRHGTAQVFALRFYEGKEQQRAVFTDVLSFRDASLPVEERVSKVRQRRVSKTAPGGAKDVFIEARITEWRNPDNPDDSTEAADADFLGISFHEDEDAASAAKTTTNGKEFSSC